MPLRVILLMLLPILLPGVARSESVRATYSAYARGLNVLNLDADLSLTQTGYRVALAYRTAGTLGFLFPGEQGAVVEGRFVGGRAAPRRFDSEGRFRGKPRAVGIDYPAGDPVVRSLVPANDGEREPVPPALLARAIDSMSAMAQLLRQVGATGRCDGAARTFDGRRLAELSVRTVGIEVLPATGRSSFAGPALRCDYEGRQLAGFRTEDDPSAAREPKGGSAWFAAAAPGLPPVPVRITFPAPVLGVATLYLTGVAAQSAGGL